jgi:squalene-hopene/tetraprenyl-beta-curcumene cyclase
LAAGDRDFAHEAGEQSIGWLLDCQSRDVHPYTSAAPGGWGWSDLSGSVPDADDTSGALLALASHVENGPDSPASVQQERIASAATLGIDWLLDLANSDGGWPTFCRGWGKLPFDRSGTDLTAHALQALHAWRTIGLGATARQRVDRAVSSGFEYLARQQQPDGAWAPLWFGNHHHPLEENPIYGTSRVLLAYSELGRPNDLAARRGLDWLASQQRPDGAWGREPSVEETALAVEAMLAAGENSAYDQHVERGLDWLVGAVESGQFRQPSPIGFYFAKLWYYEALYPVIFTVAALGRAVRRYTPVAVERPVDRPSDHRPRPPEPILTTEPAPLA